MKPRSLRARLLLGAATLTAAALIALGVMIDAAVGRVLLAEYDASLLAKATSLASMVEQTQGRVQFEFQRERMPEFSRSAAPEYFQVWLDHKPFVRSDSLGSQDLGGPPADESGGARGVVLPDGRAGRAMSLLFTPYRDTADDSAATLPPPPASLIIARDTQSLDRTRSRLRWAIVVLSTAAVGLTCGGLLLLIHLATRPIRHLAARIEGIGETDLAVRLETGALPSELTPVVDRLNGLLSRLESAMERERSFTADAAHELRTPLAGLRATLEVCRTRPREAAGYESAIDKSLDQLARMQSLVESLLLLARADAGQTSVELQPVNLLELLNESWLAVAPRAAERNLRFTQSILDYCTVMGDAHYLGVVFTNLFNNAISHADAGGEIHLKMEAADDEIAVSLSNTATGLQPEKISRVFERFWRGDDSRSQTGRHAGLGLSLSRRLLSLMHNTIDVECKAGVFTVTVRLKALVETMEPVRPNSYLEAHEADRPNIT